MVLRLAAIKYAVTTSHPSTPSADFRLLPPRAAGSHKGTFGTVAVIGGSDDPFPPHQSRMIGAPAISALAALRSGAGLVKLVMPSSILSNGLTICPSATGIPIPNSSNIIDRHDATATIDLAATHASVLAIGPGLGTSPGAQAATLRAIQQEALPVVIDADALNLLSEIPEFMKDFHAAAVLTPHPGEFKRLCAGLGLANDLGIATSREKACEQLAQRLGRVIVLKGHATVVSDGQRTWTCPTGHPCLATAGTGDVLTGLIAGLIAQFCPTVEQTLMKTKVPRMPMPPDKPLDLFNAACIGVYAHGRAGELWAEQHKASAGLIAIELVEQIPHAIEELRAK